MIEYSECEKFHAVHDESQKLGDFLVWLKSKYILYTFIPKRDLDDEDGYSEGLYPDHRSIESILAEYFDIDMDKVEEERRQILESFRSKDAT